LENFFPKEGFKGGLEPLGEKKTFGGKFLGQTGKGVKFQEGFWGFWVPNNPTRIGLLTL